MKDTTMKKENKKTIYLVHESFIDEGGDSDEIRTWVFGSRQKAKKFFEKLIESCRESMKELFDDIDERKFNMNEYRYGNGSGWSCEISNCFETLYTSDCSITMSVLDPDFEV